MLIGALVNNVAVLQGDSSVMFTSYPPMQATAEFYLGLILFAVGALVACSSSSAPWWSPRRKAPTRARCRW